MEILAHRGCWNSEIENNSPKALRSALELGFGFESDLRDYCGELVISHNIASSVSRPAGKIFEWLGEFGDQYCFAINIKADGLKDLLIQELDRCQLKNYFTFDMSVPQMVEFREIGLIYFTRQSEVEPNPVMYEDAAGVWIDAFENDNWITENLLSMHIKNGKTVCLVSPELHQRPNLEFWNRILQSDVDFSKVLLCTDYPLQAREFFSSKMNEVVK